MFSDNLKKYRKRKGLSQNDIAEKLFVTRQCVSKWESGITQPDIEMLKSLSELLEVPVDSLIGNDETTVKSEVSLNNTLFIIHIITAVFCILSYLALWRFLPDRIAAHWNISGKIDRYGEKNEIFLHLITVIEFFAVDALIYFVFKRRPNKKAIITTHSVLLIVQLAFPVFITALYAKYLTEALPFILCISSNLLMCVSAAMHPKINKRNYLLGVRTAETLSSPAVWKKVNALACYLFSGISLAIFIISMVWVSEFSLLLLLIYLPLTAVAVIYAKLLKRKSSE